MLKNKELKVKPPPKEPVSVRLTNRRAQFRCEPEVQALLKPLFAYDVPGAKFSDAYRAGGWDGRQNMMRSGGVAAGLYLEMRADLEAAGWKFVEEDSRSRPERVVAPPDPEARPYQREAVEAMLLNLRTGGVVLVATGAGKTRLTGDFFRRLKGSCLFVVDELTLLAQSQKELERASGEEVGVVGRGEFKPRRLTAATVQTLHARRNDPAFKRWYKSVEVAVIDELHVALNRRNVDVIKDARPKAVFGLTATLEWEKPHVRMPAAAMCGPIIYRYPMAQGVREGYLSRGVAVCVGYEDALKGVAPGYHYQRGEERISVPPGSPEADYRYRIALSAPRNEMIAALAREGVWRGRRVVVLVERLSHLRALARRLADVPLAVMCGAVKHAERTAGKDAMDAGELPLLIATRVFGKGVDIKTVSVVIDATGLPNRNASQQRYGRGARPAEGKDGLIYLDVADIGNRHAGAAYVRQKALEDLGVRVIKTRWKGDAAKVYEAAEEGE